MNMYSRHKINLPMLDGMRFFAAYCILFSHSTEWLGLFKDDVSIVRVGQWFTTFGMPLFFVLSGFVIHYNYEVLFQKSVIAFAAIKFLFARIARIYPLFLLCLLVGIATDEVLLWTTDHKVIFNLVIVHNLTLTQDWIYCTIFGDRKIQDGPFGLSWSISAEFFFYFTYIFVSKKISKLSDSRILLRLILFLVVLIYSLIYYLSSNALIFEFYASKIFHYEFPLWGHSAFHYLVYYSPYIRAFEFYLGCLTAQLYLNETNSGVIEKSHRDLLYFYLSLIGLLSLSVYHTATWGPNIGGTENFFIFVLKHNFGPALPIAFIIYYSCKHQDSYIAKFFSSSYLVKGGGLTFSIYCLHTFTLRIFERTSSNFTYPLYYEAIFRIIISIIVTIIFSYGVYELVEKPARHYMRNKFDKIENVLSMKLSSDRFLFISEYLVVIPVILLPLFLIYQFYIIPYFIIPLTK